jgi:hypothetical protein
MLEETQGVSLETDVPDTFVLLLFGKGDKVTHCAVSMQDNSERFCALINNLRLADGETVYARVIKAGEKIVLKHPYPRPFSSIAAMSDDDVKALLREVDAIDIARALKKADYAVTEKIFKNMSDRAAQMLQENIEFMGPARFNDVLYSQKKMLDIAEWIEKKTEKIL